MAEDDARNRKIAALREEHRKLDEKIAGLSKHAVADQIELQRLKKRKLQLKDEIARLESDILPDIIA
ncbi:MAG: YdcH family protein [Alphaproteobacteria bacterium]